MELIGGSSKAQWPHYKTATKKEEKNSKYMCTTCGSPTTDKLIPNLEFFVYFFLNSFYSHVQLNYIVIHTLLENRIIKIENQFLLIENHFLIGHSSKL